MYEFCDNFDEWVSRYWDTLPDISFWYDKIPFKGKLVDQLEEEDGYVVVAIRDEYTISWSQVATSFLYIIQTVYLRHFSQSPSSKFLP